MRIAHWDDPTLFYDDPNFYWGDPSYVLEPGDPGYVAPFPSPTKTTHRMKRQPYLPDDDAGILAVLTALEMNLPGALAAKYDVDDAQILRLRHGRYSFAWFVEANPLARQWSQSLTEAHDRMTDATPGPLEPLPGLPMLPPPPTFGTPPVTAQLEPGFFDFLSRLVQQIKNDDHYDEADGTLLMIVGSEVPPPDSQIVPEVRWSLGPNGRPILSVKKTPFQGYQMWAARGAGPLVEAGFSTTRTFELPLALPAAGQAEVWRVQVQYRYKGQPFGQRSQIVEIPVRGS